MRLEERLRRLRGTTAPQHAQATPTTDLAERLRRLSPAARRSEREDPPDERALAEGLGAEILCPGLLRAEQRVPLLQRHGRVRLDDCAAALPSLVEGDAEDPNTWLFLDTETSGLAGGTGTWAFLCGLARIEGPDLRLRQYLLTRLDAEPVYLTAVGAELERARLLVTYNGKAFDAPLLVTRFRLAGMPSPLADKAHLDLLVAVRRAFGSNSHRGSLSTAGLLDLARLHRLRGDWAGALAIWESLADQGEAKAIESLAKYLEHRVRDYRRALSLAGRLPAGPAREHRCQRLEGRLEGNAPVACVPFGAALQPSPTSS